MSVYYIMTDFVNNYKPVSDSSGLYSWLRVLCGGDSEFGGIKMRGNLFDKHGREILGTVDAIDPPGTVVGYGGIEAPFGWLICDGSAVSRTLYPDLFFVEGELFGVGDGVTTFNIPDLRGRTMCGPDNGAGRVTANNQIAVGGGSESHVQLVSELASHSHGVNYHTDGAEESAPGVLAGESIYALTSNAMDTGMNADTGTSDPMDIMKPYLCINYIIKT